MSERYQREIEEILQEVGESTPTTESRKTESDSLLAPLSRIGRSVGNLVYLSSGRLMTICIVLLVSAIFVSVIFPGLLGPIVWLGLIVFILVYALFFAKPSHKTEKLWRGRTIDEPQSAWRGESLWYRIQRWLKR